MITATATRKTEERATERAAHAVAAMTSGNAYGCVTVRSRRRARAVAVGSGADLAVSSAPDHTEATTAAFALARATAPGESPIRYAAVNGIGMPAVLRASRLVADRLGHAFRGPDDIATSEAELVPRASLDQNPVQFIHDVISELPRLDRYSVSVEAHATVENRLVVGLDHVPTEETSRSAAIVVDVFDGGRLVADVDVAWSGAAPADFASLTQALDRAIHRASARWLPVPARVHLLLEDGTAGVFLHEVCGHLLESTRQRPSLLSRRTSRLVAADHLTVADNPCQDGVFGSYRHTMLGAPARRRPLLTAGYLTGLLEDTPDGPWRAENARYIPQPRMSHLELAPASSSAAMDIAQGAIEAPVARVHRFGRGSLDHRDGTVVIEVKDATLEEGEGSRHLEPFLITLEAREALLAVRAVGDGASVRTWSAYCLAQSGSVQVSAATPSMLTGPVATLPYRPVVPPRTAAPSHGG